MTAGRNTTIIYNPRAGKMGARGLRRLAKATQILRDAGYLTSLLPTPGPASAGAMARRAIADGADLILAAGGDGTINEIAEGMAFSQVPLGILPAGTANVLAHEMGLGNSMERAAQRIGEWIPTRVSMGRLHCENGDSHTRLFLLMAGIGLDAQVVYNVNMPLKARVGQIAYWIAGFSLLGRQFEEFEVVADGRRVTCSFALISKVQNYGGDLKIAQSTHLLDDEFELVLFEGRSSFRYLNYLARVALRKVAGAKGMSLIRATGACISGNTSRRVYVQVDGEFAGHLPARVEMVPDALTLLMPAEYMRRQSRR